MKRKLQGLAFGVTMALSVNRYDGLRFLIAEFSLPYEGILNHVVVLCGVPFSSFSAARRKKTRMHPRSIVNERSVCGHVYPRWERHVFFFIGSCITRSG